MLEILISIRNLQFAFAFSDGQCFNFYNSVNIQGQLLCIKVFLPAFFATLYSEPFFVSALRAQFCLDHNVTTGYQAHFLVPYWKLFTKGNNCTQTQCTLHGWFMKKICFKSIIRQMTTTHNWIAIASTLWERTTKGATKIYLIFAETHISESDMLLVEVASVSKNMLIVRSALGSLMGAFKHRHTHPPTNFPLH